MSFLEVFLGTCSPFRILPKMVEIPSDFYWNFFFLCIQYLFLSLWALSHSVKMFVLRRFFEISWGSLRVHALGSRSPNRTVLWMRLLICLQTFEQMWIKILVTVRDCFCKILNFQSHYWGILHFSGFVLLPQKWLFGTVEEFGFDHFFANFRILW